MIPTWAVELLQGASPMVAGIVIGGLIALAWIKSRGQTETSALGQLLVMHQDNVKRINDLEAQVRTLTTGLMQSQAQRDALEHDYMMLQRKLDRICEEHGISVPSLMPMSGTLKP